MKDVLTGRVDLVRVLAAGGAELQEAVARLLGMESLPPEPAPPRVAVGPSTAPPPVAEPTLPIVETTPVPFWYASSFAVHELVPLGQTIVVERVPDDAGTAIPPDWIHFAFGPLASVPAILTGLRRVAAFSRTSAEPDVPRIIEQLSRGRFPGALPRRARKSWGPSIHVVIDHHEHLAPYWEDQDDAVRALSRVYPRDGVEVAILREGESDPRLVRPRREATYRLPEPGTTVVALSDLGSLTLEPSHLAASWLDLGRRYREHGNRPVALVPCDAALIPAELARDWTILSWEHPVEARHAALNPAETERVAGHVLTLLSFALRLEPRLIRAVRRLLVKGRLGAGIEARVWQDEALQSRHHQAAAFRFDAARILQAKVEDLPSELRRKVYEIAEQSHASQYLEVWFAERLALEREAARVGLTDDGLKRAVQWFEQQPQVLRSTSEQRDPTSDQALWFRRVQGRLPESVMSGRAGAALHEIFSLTASSDDRPPAGLDVARLSPRETTPWTIALHQFGDHLVAQPWTAPSPAPPQPTAAEPPGSLLGLIRTRNPWIEAVPVPARPAWMYQEGKDRYGDWCSFRVKDVVQRMRWIAPGEFLMGSPSVEEGRDDNEGPEHSVRITRGFWLFETPCTQALWEAVMEKDPNQFKSPSRPVEQVSWEDCQEFIERLNDLLEGVNLSLPSEAQWEYACRAGSQAPRYREPVDEIAWYRENSDGEAHPVGARAPNDWGLYDMLGNVWEWCLDGFDSDFYGESPREDPVAPPSAFRVFRGGSWDSIAWGVRAACRDASDPGSRGEDLGFRCAEFQSAGPARAGPKEERGLSGSEPGAEHGEDRETPSGTRWLRNLDGAGDRLVLQGVAPVRLVSDVEELTLSVLTRPSWASAVGRDEFGLWAEFVIGGSARQRLRWIPPGRFVMGSPSGEAGEFAPSYVRISEGFWLFDTPCTQELWEAVMGENPSRFKSPSRPVEHVNWNDCQEFVKRLNGMQEGLSLSLPSEAQWEYACRAGTTTATYAGDLEISGENQASFLDGIAWYRGNCGVGFELSEGRHISDWPEMQSGLKTGGTHPVGGKAPNEWGLYDMLGNVFEWCEELFRVKSRASQRGARAHRVIRGGSWSARTQMVRAASRLSLGPSSRYDSVGFRCAEFRAGKEDEEQVVSGSEPGAEHGEEREPTSGRRARRKKKKKK